MPVRLEEGDLGGGDLAGLRLRGERRPAGALLLEHLAGMRAHDATHVRDGVLGVGFSHRVPVSAFVPFLDRLLSDGGMFIRNGSGALMLSYVAAGRLIGYYEPHINSWDCLAAIVLVREAGGEVNDFLANNGLHDGNPIIAAGAQVYPALLTLVYPC